MRLESVVDSRKPPRSFLEIIGHLRESRLVFEAPKGH